MKIIRDVRISSYYQLFFVDDIGAKPDLDITLDDVYNDNHELKDDEDEAGESDSDPSHSDVQSSSSRSSPTPAPQKPILKSRKPAWTDPSDTPAVSLSAPRLRKLRDAPTESSISGREYETRLRRQYERINPEPQWAAKARKGGRTARENDDEDDEEGEHGVRGLLSSTSGILAPSRRKSRAGVVLPAGTLAIERLRDANQAAQGSACGEVKTVAFHPSDKVPVLCVGTADRRIRLFNVSVLRFFSASDASFHFSLLWYLFHLLLPYSIFSFIRVQCTY